jgi:solute carrier family 25 (adenine nucleotide translocator) protein 4/5/6/31
LSISLPEVSLVPSPRLSPPPIERAEAPRSKTQDANPKDYLKVKSLGQHRIVDCFSRVAKEQGIKAFWRETRQTSSVISLPQAFNFAFKDTIKALFPKESAQEQGIRKVLHD